MSKAPRCGYSRRIDDWGEVKRQLSQAHSENDDIKGDIQIRILAVSSTGVTSFGFKGPMAKRVKGSNGLLLAAACWVKDEARVSPGVGRYTYAYNVKPPRSDPSVL